MIHQIWCSEDRAFERDFPTKVGRENFSNLFGYLVWLEIGNIFGEYDCLAWSGTGVPRAREVYPRSRRDFFSRLKRRSHFDDAFPLSESWCCLVGEGFG